MSWSIKICVLVSIACIISCSTQKEMEEQEIHQLIAEQTYGKKEINSLLILTEEGCPNCNRSFANFLAKQLQKEETLCIVAAAGNVIDLSPFLADEKILLDFNGALRSKYSFLNQTAGILLNDEHKIDTVVKIEAKNLESSLTFLEQKIN